MTQDARKKLDRFFRVFAPAATPLLLLDYDGTLAPFRRDRYQARPWAGVRELLNQIQVQGSTRIVFVTGRPAADILPLLGLECTPEVWGLHGVERLLPNGRRQLEKLTTVARKELVALRSALRSNAFGALLEEKPNSVVLHWRGIAPRKAREIAENARALFEPASKSAGLIVLEFESGIELRAGRNKGGAVQAILREYRGRSSQPAAYLGDDLTDEAAFAAIKGHGLSVLVRRERRKTAADLWLRPPQELREFLERWLRASAGVTHPAK